MSAHILPLYTFPPMKGLEHFYRNVQLHQIRGELREAFDALDDYELKEGEYGEELEDILAAREAFGMELLDIIHATETLLRMEFTDQEVWELVNKVAMKNADRNYYDEAMTKLIQGEWGNHEEATA